MIIYYNNNALEEKLSRELDDFLLELQQESDASLTFEDILLPDDEALEVEAEKSIPCTKHAVNEFNAFFDAYARRLSESKSVHQAEQIEASVTTIENYPIEKVDFISDKVDKCFKLNQPSVTAVIDWLALEFRVNRSAFVFKHPDKPFQDIRKLMKDHAIDPNLYVVNSRTDRSMFTIHLHDIARVDQLHRVVELLQAHYGASPHEMRITTLELSLDFWNIRTKGMLLALSKSVRALESVQDEDFRVYLSPTRYSTMPKDPLKAMSYISQGYTIGIGHMRDDVYIRAYYKQTDRNAELPKHKRRLRIEVNLKGKTLEAMGNHTGNLKALIQQGFKYLSFTRLNAGVTDKEQARYVDQVELFGRSTSVISRSRNRRNLPDYIKPNRELNDAIRKSVYNLSRYF